MMLKGYASSLMVNMPYHKMTFYSLLNIRIQGTSS